jgi:Mg-chelatase subunit ChlD
MYTYPQALDAMQKIAQDLLGPRYAVSVIADASTGTASVVWENLYHPTSVTIRMPVLPAKHRMTQAEFDDYAGYILHETGHPKYTDKATWEAAVKAGRANLLNALEDVRIEKKLIDDGVAKNGRDVLSALVRSLDYSCGRDDFDPNDSRNIGFVMGFLGRAANGYDMDASLVTRKLDPKGSVSKVLKWALSELAACQSTADCLALAKKLVAALPAPKKPKPQQGQPKPQEGQPKPQEGQQGQPKPQEGQQGQPKPQEGQEGQPKPQEGQQGQPKPQEGQQGQGQGQGQGENEPQGKLTDADIAEVDLRPKAPAALPQGSHGAGMEAVIIGIIRDNAKRKAEVKPRDGSKGNGVASEAAKAAKQRALLARALKANDLDTFDGGLKHGRLDRRAFAKAGAGQTNIFGKRDLIEGYESDVVVLVDGSGSMNGRNIQSAAVLALVIAQAAAQVGVSCTTYMFGASYGKGPGSRVEISKGRARPDIAKFEAMPVSCGSDTPLTKAMLISAMEQVQRAPAKRKVMFMVSDGGCNMGPVPVRKAAAYVESLGVELANLFIGDKPMGCFRNEVAINGSKPVAEAGLAQLVKVLEKGLPS